MKNECKQSFFGYVRGRFTRLPFLIISVLYIGFCLFAAIRWTVGGIPGHVFLSSAFILFIPAMLAVEYLMKLRFGPVFMVAVLSIAVGAILGSPFGMYSIVPFFDDILHTLSGFVFAALGFALSEFFFGRAGRGRKFAGTLVFAAFFSLGLAVLWELWEFGGMLLLGMETADDTIVDSFTTFILHGRSEATVLDGILKTVIHYGNGQTLIVDGYLDIGYYDTVLDMVVCTAGTLVFTLVAIIAHFKLPSLERALIPQLADGEDTRSLSSGNAEPAAEEGGAECIDPEPAPVGGVSDSTSPDRSSEASGTSEGCDAASEISAEACADSDGREE